MYHTIYHTKKLFKINYKKVLTLPVIQGTIKTVKRDKEKQRKQILGG